VEYPCHKCGAGVEDGTPFCKQCGAPQIRVMGIEPDLAAPPVSDSHESPPLVPPLRLPVAAPPSAGVQWSHALPGAALGGAFSLLAAVVPYAIFGPAFMAGGAVSVMLYRRHVKDRLPTPGAGAQIGAASGGFGFLFFAIPAIATLVYRPEELRHGMLDSISQLVSRGYDPQKLQQVQELLKSPEGLIFFVAFGLFVMLLMFVGGSSIGGALYAAWLRKKLQL
jgi:hypothetical protein